MQTGYGVQSYILYSYFTMFFKKNSYIKPVSDCLSSRIEEDWLVVASIHSALLSRIPFAGDSPSRLFVDPASSLPIFLKMSENIIVVIDFIIFASSRKISAQFIWNNIAQPLSNHHLGRLRATNQYTLEVLPIWAQTSHSVLWLVVSQRAYGESLRFSFFS